MKAVIAKYPFHAVNYVIGGVRGTDGVFHEDPSFVVVIPRAAGNGYYDSNDGSTTDLAAGGQGGQGGLGSRPGRGGFFGNPAGGSSGRTDPTGLANPFPPATPSASGTYGAQIRDPGPGDAPGVGHLRRVGE